MQSRPDSRELMIPLSHESLGELYNRRKTIERFADFTAETRMKLSSS